MSKKSFVAALLCAVAVTGANASAAFAGEITGNGKPTAGPARELDLRLLRKER